MGVYANIIFVNACVRYVMDSVGEFQERVACDGIAYAQPCLRGKGEMRSEAFRVKVGIENPSAQIQERDHFPSALEIIDN